EAPARTELAIPGRTTRYGLTPQSRRIRIRSHALIVRGGLGQVNRSQITARQPFGPRSPRASLSPSYRWVEWTFARRASERPGGLERGHARTADLTRLEAECLLGSGEGGIRTLEAGTSPPTRFPVALLKPLGHLSETG